MNPVLIGADRGDDGDGSDADLGRAQPADRGTVAADRSDLRRAVLEIGKAVTFAVKRIVPAMTT